MFGDSGFACVYPVVFITLKRIHSKLVSILSDVGCFSFRDCIYSLACNLRLTGDIMDHDGHSIFSVLIIGVIR